MASVLPRSFWVDGKKVLCGQVVEFAVDPAYRSLGPAVLMQRATFEPVNSGQVAFGYDCPPHDRGMSTFVRLGIQSSADVLRYALLLRCDEYLGERIGKGAWTGPLVATVNLALRLSRSGKSVPGLEICQHDKAFDEEFSNLDRYLISAGKIRAGRAAEDLNWRYLEDPWAANGSSPGSTAPYRVFVARRAGELVAFAILFVQTDGIAWIVDLFGRDLLSVGRTLLEAVIDVCRRERVIRIDVLCSVESDLKSLVESAGFRARERVYRVVAYENARQAPQLLNSGLRWAFTNSEVM